MHRVIMNIFIIIIEQGYMSVKYKKAYDWLEEDDTDVYFNPDPTNRPPNEINIGKGGKQTAYEKEIFIKLRDAFEGINDGNRFGQGAPIDNHPILSNKTLVSQGQVAQTIYKAQTTNKQKSEQDIESSGTWVKSNTFNKNQSFMTRREVKSKRFFVISFSGELS